LTEFTCCDRELRDIMGYRFFNPSQMSLAKAAFDHAEQLVANYYRFGRRAFQAYRYDIRTLAELETHEIQDGAFAHLCRYRYEKKGLPDASRSFQFYRVCLQDNRILDAVERANSFIKFAPLMLYIAAHELVHVIRFDEGLFDFEAPQEEKIREEEIVHAITRQIMQPVVHHDLGLVLDCFSSQYQIGDLYN